MNVVLGAEDVTLGYGKKTIAKHLDVCFDKPEIVSIIGPNGSGKSTLLKALARLLAPHHGTVYLKGEDMAGLPLRQTARQIALLPQSTVAPGDMTVRELAAFGRLPYQSAFSALHERDWAAIDRALQATEMTALAHEPLTSLSGGERQRAWLAMALAKEPEILLLDEPTTYLDVHHQIELMELVEHLYETQQILVIMVMHDLNHAARFSHRLIAVQEGRIVADGPVREVFRPEVLEPLYDIKAQVLPVAEDGREQIVCIPYATRHAAAS